MNWEAIGALGEILGALAVVATLVYLASQVRHARDAAADINRLSRAEGVRQWQIAMVANPEARARYNRALGIEQAHQEMADQLGISAEDMSVAENGNIYWFWLHWGQFASTTSKADMEELAHLIDAFYRNPAIRMSWDNSPYGKSLLDPSFVKFVDDILAAEPGTYRVS